jgi:hypothetical protein
MKITYKTALAAALLAVCSNFRAECAVVLTDSFADGNFSSGPAWSGDTSSWQIVTSSDVAAGAADSNSLRLAVASGSGTQHLSASVSGFDDFVPTTWSFFVGRRGQAATAANPTTVFLAADAANLESASLNGYAITFGDDTGNDEIRLQKFVNGTASTVLTSTDAITNGRTDWGLGLKVTRSSAGEWSLYSSHTLSTLATGGGAIATDSPSLAAVSLGSATDTSVSMNDLSFFGILATHSTGAGSRAGLEFDQLTIDVTAVPEPSTYAGFAGALLLGFGVWRRSRRS